MALICRDRQDLWLTYLRVLAKGVLTTETLQHKWLALETSCIITALKVLLEHHVTNKFPIEQF